MSDTEWPKRMSFPKTREEFEAVLQLFEPVVFTGVADSWPALDKWTPEYLANVSLT